jgi:hypothetical protein
LILGDGSASGVPSALNSAKDDLGYTGTITYTTKNIVGADSGYTGSDLTTLNYDVVMLYMNGGSPPSSSLGTAINNFVTAGGHLVIGVFAWSITMPGLDYANYSVFNNNGFQTYAGSAVTHVSSHPIFNKINPAGVTLTSNANSGMTLTSGTTAIATLSSPSTSFIGVRQIGSARSVGVNVFPTMSWTTGVNQNSNSLRYIVNSIYWCIGALA